MAEASDTDFPLHVDRFHLPEPERTFPNAKINFYVKDSEPDFPPTGDGDGVSGLLRGDPEELCDRRRLVAAGWVHLWVVGQEPYFWTGAAHAPHQPPLDWRGRNAGRFDMGWDEYRRQVHDNQLQMGIIPQGTELTERPEQIPSCDSQPPEHQALFARQAENFADFLEHTDYEVGRVVDAFEELGELDRHGPPSDWQPSSTEPDTPATSSPAPTPSRAAKPVRPRRSTTNEGRFRVDVH